MNRLIFSFLLIVLNIIILNAKTVKFDSVRINNKTISPANEIILSDSDTIIFSFNTAGKNNTSLLYNVNLIMGDDTSKTKLSNSKVRYVNLPEANYILEVSTFNTSNSQISDTSKLEFMVDNQIANLLAQLDSLKTKLKNYKTPIIKSKPIDSTYYIIISVLVVLLLITLFFTLKYKFALNRKSSISYNEDDIKLKEIKELEREKSNLEDKSYELISAIDELIIDNQNHLKDNITEKLRNLHRSFTLFDDYKLDIKEAELNKIILDIQEKHLMSYTKKNQVFECELDENIPKASIDINLISDMLDNLFSNAIKFTDNNGSIKVSSKYDNNHFIITVTDNGIGLNKDDLTKIFKKEVQLEDKTKNKYDGLGLWVVKKVADLHNGSVSVKSTKGKGTTFTINLPKQNQKVNKKQ